MNDLTIALVLKSGGDYDYNYVNVLASNIKKNLTADHEIVVITDTTENLNYSNIDRTTHFYHDFPKWWGKIELFRPGLFNGNRVLYLDLDTIVVDNIDEIVKYDGTFMALRDFYNLHKVGSGLMMWDSSDKNYESIYNNFLGISRYIMNNYREGDQRWIEEQIRDPKYFQDVFPNKIVSYKVHCIDRRTKKIGIPKNAAIICFHGKPRPHEVNDPSIRNFWSTS